MVTERFNPEKALQVLAKFLCYWPEDRNDPEAKGGEDLRTLFYMVHAMERFSYRNFGHTVLHDTEYRVRKRQGGWPWVYPVNLYRMFIGKNRIFRKAHPNLRAYRYPAEVAKNIEEAFSVDPLFDEDDTDLAYPYMGLSLRIKGFRDKTDLLSPEDEKAIKFTKNIEDLFFDDVMDIYPETFRHNDGDIIKLQEFLSDPTEQDVIDFYKLHKYINHGQVPEHYSKKENLVDEWFHYRNHRLFEDYEYDIGKKNGWEFDFFSPKFPLHPDNCRKFYNEIENVRRQEEYW